MDELVGPEAFIGGISGEHNCDCTYNCNEDAQKVPLNSASANT